MTENTPSDAMVEAMAQAIYEADDPWHVAWPWPDLQSDQAGVDHYRRCAEAAAAVVQTALDDRASTSSPVDDSQTGNTIVKPDIEAAIKSDTAPVSDKLRDAAKVWEHADRAGEDAYVEAMARAVEPWQNFHGELPDYDHPLRCVYESGIQYAVALLAKELSVEDWEACDGTEEFDGDLGGTMMNIVCAALPEDEHGDRIWPSQVAEAMAERDAEIARLREAHDKAGHLLDTFRFESDADVFRLIDAARAALGSANDHD